MVEGNRRLHNTVFRSRSRFFELTKNNLRETQRFASCIFLCVKKNGYIRGLKPRIRNLSQAAGSEIYVIKTMLDDSG